MAEHDEMADATRDALDTLPDEDETPAANGFHHETLSALEEAGHANDEGARSRRVEYHGATGDARGEDGDFAGALGEYKKAARLDPHSAKSLTKLAEGYAAADLPHKALDFYQRALEAGEREGQGDMTEAHLGIGDLARTFAHSAAAVRSYERAVRSHPKKPFYRWKLAVALAALGLYEQSAKQLQSAVELATRDAFYRFYLADVLLLMRRDDEAIEQLEEVVALAPRDDYYRLRLGAALLRDGRTLEAVPHFERAVVLQPDNAAYRALVRFAHARDERLPAIAVDVEMLELSAYDQDFVRRIQKMSEPV